MSLRCASLMHGGQFDVGQRQKWTIILVQNCCHRDSNSEPVLSSTFDAVPHQTGHRVHIHICITIVVEHAGFEDGLSLRHKRRLVRDERKKREVESAKRLTVHRRTQTLVLRGLSNPPESASLGKKKKIVKMKMPLVHTHLTKKKRWSWQCKLCRH